MQTPANQGAGSTSPPYTWVMGSPVWDVDLRKWTDWTKTGILLLMVGILVSFVPFIGLLGGLLELIGAILVILGRKAFGPLHGRYVLISVGIFIIGIISTVILIFALVLSVLFSLPVNPTSAAINQAVISTLTAYFPAIVILSAFTTLSYVLFTYAIQNQTGRSLLWAAYGLGLIIEVAVFYLIQSVPNLISQSSSSVTFNPIALAGLYSVGYLDILPYALYVIAYYLLYNRISRGELPGRSTPAPPTQPTMPPTF